MFLIECLEANDWDRFIGEEEISLVENTVVSGIYRKTYGNVELLFLYIMNPEKIASVIGVSGMSFVGTGKSLFVSGDLAVSSTVSVVAA